MANKFFNNKIENKKDNKLNKKQLKNVREKIMFKEKLL